MNRANLAISNMSTQLLYRLQDIGKYFSSNEDDKKSYTGYVFLINGGAVTWSTHKQLTVAFSSMESEYMALSDAAREALARRQLFEELRLPSASKPVTILTDSQTALDISENPANYRQAKHIDIRYHTVGHYIHERKIEIDHIPSNYQSLPKHSDLPNITDSVK